MVQTARAVASKFTRPNSVSGLGLGTYFLPGRGEPGADSPVPLRRPVAARNGGGQPLNGRATAVAWDRSAGCKAQSGFQCAKFTAPSSRVSCFASPPSAATTNSCGYFPSNDTND